MGVVGCSFNNHVIAHSPQNVPLTL